MAKKSSTKEQWSSRLCHISSPRQNRAISSDQNIHRPRKEKIGWCNHSENGFRVQSNNAILVVGPVISPKLAWLQSVQLRIGIPAQSVINTKATIVDRSGRCIGSRQWARIVPAAIVISGKLLNFVRKVAAIARPVIAPR